MNIAFIDYFLNYSQGAPAAAFFDENPYVPVRRGKRWGGKMP